MGGIEYGTELELNKLAPTVWSYTSSCMLIFDSAKPWLSECECRGTIGLISPFILAQDPVQKEVLKPLPPHFICPGSSLQGLAELCQTWRLLALKEEHFLPAWDRIIHTGGRFLFWHTVIQKVQTRATDWAGGGGVLKKGFSRGGCTPR